MEVDGLNHKLLVFPKLLPQQMLDRLPFSRIQVFYVASNSVHAVKGVRYRYLMFVQLIAITR